jgi:hypothetical protein
VRDSERNFESRSGLSRDIQLNIASLAVVSRVLEVLKVKDILARVLRHNNEPPGIGFTWEQTDLVHGCLGSNRVSPCHKMHCYVFDGGSRLA